MSNHQHHQDCHTRRTVPGACNCFPGTALGRDFLSRAAPSEIAVGDRVRSFDFQSRDVEGDRACYVEGTVERIGEPPFQLDTGHHAVYAIRVERRVFNGWEVTEGWGAVGDRVFPPVNGIPKTFGGVTDGVVKVEPAEVILVDVHGPIENLKDHLLRTIARAWPTDRGPGRRDLDLFGDQIDRIVALAIKEGEARASRLDACGADGCGATATAPDPYGGFDVCAEHEAEFLRMQRNGGRR